MNLTSVLVIINDMTMDVSNIRDNLKYAGSKTQLLVYNNLCRNQNVINELQKASSVWVENNTPFLKNYSECVNELLRISSGDFICFSREDGLYCENWLKSLIEWNNFVENTGVISIYDFSTNEGTYQLTKENTLEWVYSSNFRINNFAFFKRELIFKIGGLNETINGVYSIWDFCDRARIKGFFNYFVPNTSRIQCSVYTDHFLEPNPSQFEKRKVLEFFKIFNLNIETENKLKTLTAKFGDYFTFQEKLGSIVFSKKNELDFDFLNELCNCLLNMNLQIKLYSSSYFENDVLKQSFIGLIDPKK